ncbi:MAG: YfbR-like 5'-deoxynucleotidase [Desulfovibrionaceae bacterium]
MANKATTTSDHGAKPFHLPAQFLPPLAAPPGPLRAAQGPPPDPERIRSWWNLHGVMEHIRAHSAQVARVAHHMAIVGAERGIAVEPERVLAAGLLHDIAKTYSVRFGGNHCQIGAAWTLELTGDLLLAHCVYHHVYWPFELDLERYFAPLAVLYADKRVAHTTVVSLAARYDDLIERYGTSEVARRRIRETERQAMDIEQRFSELLGEDINACAFDRGRLVV